MNGIPTHKILTIIVTYNGASWVEQCIYSLSQSSIATDICVIDNKSTDATRNIINDNFPIVHLIVSKENVGFGRANNVGLNIALANNYDFVFLLNQDARVEVNCLENLVKAHTNNKQVAVFSPWQYNYEGTANETYFNDFVLKDYTAGIALERTENDFSKIYFTRFVHAAAWFMPIATVKEVGGFDPIFFYTGEDNDYVQRLQHKKKQIALVTDAVVYHEGSNTALVDPVTNAGLHRNAILLQLKSPAATTKGALALFMKNYGKLLIAVKRNKASAKDKMLYTVYSEILPSLKKIYSSREEQPKPRAFL